MFTYHPFRGARRSQNGTRYRNASRLPLPMRRDLQPRASQSPALHLLHLVFSSAMWLPTRRSSPPRYQGAVIGPAGFFPCAPPARGLEIAGQDQIASSTIAQRLPATGGSATLATNVGRITASAMSQRRKPGCYCCVAYGAPPSPRVAWNLSR